jgi:hypothetical protein
MHLTTSEKFTRALALVAGSLDAGTGLGLVFTPGLLLRLMRVAPVGPEAETYLRFTGVFVALVGFSYLWALVRGAATLRVVLALTAGFRLAVGIFCTWAIVTGRLAPAWTSVPVTDLLLAAVQGWLLARGVFQDAA